MVRTAACDTRASIDSSRGSLSPPDRGAMLTTLVDARACRGGSGYACLVHVAPGTVRVEHADDSLRALQHHQMGTLRGRFLSLV
jgi:hypothetical protein